MYKTITEYEVIFTSKKGLFGSEQIGVCNGINEQIHPNEYNATHSLLSFTHSMKDDLAKEIAKDGRKLIDLDVVKYDRVSTEEITDKSKFDYPRNSAVETILKGGVAGILEQLRKENL